MGSICSSLWSTELYDLIKQTGLTKFPLSLALGSKMTTGFFSFVVLSLLAILSFNDGAIAYFIKA